MNADRFQELKDKLVNGQDFSEIWHYYMDHFADHVEFIEMGTPGQNLHLETAIHTTCIQLFGQAPKKGFGKTTRVVSDAKFFLIKIQEYDFFHGPVQVGKKMGGVIYFSDIKTGLVAMSSSSDDNVQYSRFSEPFPLAGADPNDYN
jgi:hypothetical protein